MTKFEFPLKNVRVQIVYSNHYAFAFLISEKDNLANLIPLQNEMFPQMISKLKNMGDETAEKSTTS